MRASGRQWSGKVALPFCHLLANRNGVCDLGRMGVDTILWVKAESAEHAVALEDKLREALRPVDSNHDLPIADWSDVSSVEVDADYSPWIEVLLFTRYWSEDYDRGDVPSVVEMAESIAALAPGCEIRRGPDCTCTPDASAPFGPTERADLLRRWDAHRAKERMLEVDR